MDNFGKWEHIRQIGGGGQSTVHLVRSPQRVEERAAAFKTLFQYSATNFQRSQSEAFARASYEISRPELPTELGAAKKFNFRLDIPDPEGSSLKRLQNEIEALKIGHEGFLKLLDSNESERWIITEYCEKGTLDRYLENYRGNITATLEAIIPVIETVAYLHESEKRIYHRDIKPQNIFIGAKNELLLGDFGLVFMPDAPDHPTFTGETVGPRDFMPPWVLGVNHPNISGAFDVYMLAKVLWCMLSGRQKLIREDFSRHNFDLTKMFPQNPDMQGINLILSKCLVRDEEECFPTAGPLLPWVKTLAEKLKRGGEVFTDGIPRWCRVCGQGKYIAEFREKGKDDPTNTIALTRTVNGMAEGAGRLEMRGCTCDRCGHIQFFKPVPLPKSGITL